MQLNIFHPSSSRYPKLTFIRGFPQNSVCIPCGEGLLYMRLPMDLNLKFHWGFFKREKYVSLFIMSRENLVSNSCAKIRIEKSGGGEATRRTLSTHRLLTQMQILCAQVLSHETRHLAILPQDNMTFQTACRFKTERLPLRTL
jgi:hypothetical protein